jgi:hypothetical protein
MSIQTIFILGGAFFLSLLVVARTCVSQRWVTAITLLAPVIILSIRRARYRAACVELGIGSGLAMFGLLIWWSFYGRKLPPPKESSIRVWTEDDPF